MRLNLREVPRRFSPLEGLELSDMGDVYLEEDEQLTFRTNSGDANDIVRKEWGFYLSNSLNWNLKKQGFKTALVISYASDPPRLFINLVKDKKMDSFRKYLSEYNVRVVTWLDDWFNFEG
jgi:hypothetical protein